MSPRGFTSFGRTMHVYANGLDVESVIPAGKKRAMTGTSISAPPDTNLAARILAVRPMLTPAELIGIIKQGAQSVQCQQGKLPLLNPLESVATALRGE